MTIVTKGAANQERFERVATLYPRARDAIAACLHLAGCSSGEKVLMPSYVGISPKEGSGVLDPIVNSGYQPIFYRLDERLRIDFADLKMAIELHSPAVLIVIHYFGYVDPMAATAIQFAKDRGIFVLEDEAHAMFTDLIGGGSGRAGDAAVFSLHKLLPVRSGGMLVWNKPRNHISENGEDKALEGQIPWTDYDFWKISQIRRRNAEYVHQAVHRLHEYMTSLWGLPAETEVPQSYPVIIKKHERDELYFEMNERGFGVTSLYHTLVPEISEVQFSTSHAVSKRIFNLPIHQDIDIEQLEEMMTTLGMLFHRRPPGGS